MATNNSFKHFLCLSCDKSFSSKKGLQLHAKKVHHGLTGSRIPPAKIECFELGCTFRCRQLAEFRKHLSESHGHSFAEMTCQFQDINHFHSWLRNFEKQNHVEFYRNTMNINQNSKVVYYRCNRSGFYRVSKKKVQRRTKLQGSCKIEGYCTAYIKSKEDYNTGEVTMNMCNTHYGHTIQLTHLRLPKEDRRLIEEKLTSGLELDDVIKEVKSSTSTVTNSLDRTGLIKQKDVYNVISKLRTKSPKRIKRAKSPTCNITLEELNNDYEEHDSPCVTHCLNESSAIDSLRDTAVSILQEVLLDLQTLTDLLVLHDICNHAEALKGVIKSSSSPESTTTGADHMLAVPNVTFISSVDPVNPPEYITQVASLNQDTVLLHVTESPPINQHSGINICQENHALIQLSGPDCNSVSQALHLAAAGGVSGQLAPDCPGERASSEASSDCGAGDLAKPPDPCWAAGGHGVFPAPMTDDDIRAPFQGLDNSVMLRINDVTDVLNDTAREDAMGGGCNLNGAAGDVLDDDPVHATFHVSQGHSNDVFMSEENIQFSSAGMDGSSFLLGGADGGDVLHNVLNSSHTSFSKDGRTCFVHVDKALCDQEIRIVLT